MEMCATTSAFYMGLHAKCFHPQRNVSGPLLTASYTTLKIIFTLSHAAAAAADYV